MKNNKVYGERIRQVFARYRKGISVEKAAVPTDPLIQLAGAVLGDEEGYETGAAALKRILETMLDFNELRVSTPVEIAAATVPLLSSPVPRCEVLRVVLNGVYHREDIMDLGCLRQMKVKEARAYLEGLPGMEPFACASVLLWSLEAHAIPVCGRFQALMRREQWVAPDATRAEVQSFLEHQIKASDAHVFCAMMDRLVAEEGEKPARKSRRARRTPSVRSSSSEGESDRRSAAG